MIKPEPRAYVFFTGHKASGALPVKAVGTTTLILFFYFIVSYGASHPGAYFLFRHLYRNKKQDKKFQKSRWLRNHDVAGFVLILIFLSRSKYQLPHYSFAIHPLAAVLTAKYLDERINFRYKIEIIFCILWYSYFFNVRNICYIIFDCVLYISCSGIFPNISSGLCMFSCSVCFIEVGYSAKVFLVYPYSICNLDVGF